MGNSTLFNHMVDNYSNSFDAALLALSDPTRRAILQALGSGEKRVTELADPFDMSLNGISKHVKKLEAAGLVHRRRAGREHFISARPETIENIGQWFDAQRAFWNARLDHLEQLLQEEIDNE